MATSGRSRPTPGTPSSVRGRRGPIPRARGTPSSMHWPRVGAPSRPGSPEFVERRALWAAEQGPVVEAANFALDRVVAATFRIERCERALDDVIVETRKRAQLAWDQDRAVEAATSYGRLGRDPVLASRQLQTTLAGAGLMIEAWSGLLAALEVGDWSEAAASKALDLLGVAPDLRSGRTMIDAPEELRPRRVPPGSGPRTRRSSGWSNSATRSWRRWTRWSVGGRWPATWPCCRSRPS